MPGSYNPNFNFINLVIRILDLLSTRYAEFLDYPITSKVSTEYHMKCLALFLSKNVTFVRESSISADFRQFCLQKQILFCQSFEGHSTKNLVISLHHLKKHFFMVCLNRLMQARKVFTFYTLPKGMRSLISI